MLFMLIIMMVGGYILMFLFVKYYEKIHFYYIAWFLLLTLLGSFQIDAIEVADVEAVLVENFDSEQWVYYVGLILIIIPTLYVVYPLVQLYYYMMLFLKELIDPLVHLPISRKRRKAFNENLEDIRDEQNTGLFVYPRRKDAKHETNEE